MNIEKMALPAHHRPGGGFRNPWPSARSHGFMDFLKWTLVERRKRPPADRPIIKFPLALPNFVVPRAEPEKLTITWVGHTSFLVQLGSLNLLIDPVWSERASPVSFAGPRRLTAPGVNFDRLPPIDAVVLSHDHYDHLDARTIRRLIERYPAILWYCPLGVGAFLRKRGARDVTERDWWETAENGKIDLTAVPAQHFSGRRLGKRNQTLWCGWVLKSRHHSVFFAGDTALHPEFADIARRCGPFNVAILPIGAYEPRWFMGSVHMNPGDCLEAFQTIETSHPGYPVKLVAAHWGTFKLTDEAVDEPPRLMRELWAAARLGTEDLCILRHGETRVI
ncbi:MAG: MBL fold metallo-hydrolase [Gemmatimonadaceae bacterium]